MREVFETLANDKGLVPMRLNVSSAPYFAGDIAGFHPDQAEELYKGVTKEGIRHADPVDEHGQVIEIRYELPPPEQQPSPDLVAIPDDWDAMHHLQKIKLAEKISGKPVASKEQAIQVIYNELQRR